MASVTRREFIGAVIATCACSLCPAIGLSGETTGTQTAAAPSKDPVDIGEAKDYAKDGVVDKFADKGFFVVREKDRIFAVSRVCPHKQGRIAYSPDQPNELHCTKHKGIFKSDGSLVSGPPKSPLSRLGISLNSKGRLVVNPAQTFSSAEWDKTEAFVKA